MGWTKLVEDDGTEIGTTGDSVWDLCDNFVQDLKQIYRKEIGREINKEEIKEVLHDLDMEFNIVVTMGVGEAGASWLDFPDGITEQGIYLNPIGSHESDPFDKQEGEKNAKM